MAQTSNQKETASVRLTVTANLLESKDAEKVPRGVAYAFSSGGRLLAQEMLNENGTATLNLPIAEKARSVRVMVGPEIESEKLRISELQRRGAVERILRVDPDNLTPSAEFAVAPNSWLCWLLGLCFVQGTVLKRVVSGGVNIDLPVCNATVNVYEVEPIEILIPRLTDEIIEKIRQVIINPPPPPPDGPFEALQSSTRLETMSASRDLTLSSQASAAQLALSSATDLQFLARSTSTSQFRQVLVNNAALIRYILCLFFPFVVTYLVATATTDECGHFETFFFHGCFNPDAPNLYFTVEQQVFPFPFPPFTLYAPIPIPCYTYWSYVCGTEVTLYTTNPFAITCPPCPPVEAPDNWVLFMAIGNHPLSRIYGTGSTLVANSTNLGLTDGGAPWGELLLPRIEFDNNLRDSLGVQYYQVSFRRGSSGSFQPLTGEVHRHYTHVVGGNLVLEVYSLGPKVVNGVPNLFEIPPALPPLGQWSFPDLREDLTSAKFPTDVLAPAANADIYQLKLDLFDVNGAPVDITSLGINYVVPTSTDLNGTIQTTDAASLGLVSGNSFIMSLHIDNNVCTGSIAIPTLNGVAADPDCGVLNYDPNMPGSVTMNYTASHPNGFATYNFTLVRGVNALTPPTVSGAPVGTGSFSTTQTVSYLLGGCPVAGFAETLYVAAMAVDGWERLSNYDAQPLPVAFVLAPTGN